METSFNALLVSEKDGRFVKEVQKVQLYQLPDNELFIKVSHSCINYKDALSASGNKGVTRKFPHVPGVDAAGIVIRSTSSLFAVGDEVLITGFDLGMNTWGGFGEYISVPASWVLRLPQGLTAQQAMAFGTAGLTAGLSVYELVSKGITPNKGEVVVSGATGGVGSMATAILSKLGYNVAVVSGKREGEYLHNVLGAKRIIGRDEFAEQYNSKAMASPAFAGGVDTVAGPILSGMLKATQYGGTVTCCGMVSSANVDTSIFPFILRGVSLAGIDSVLAPMNLRRHVWQLLATDWKPENLNSMVENISLNQLAAKLDEVLNGQAKGRYVLVHNE
ncbi:YhdH/YhfP family quinone oxidoreductase [Mucilaginibacter sp. PAMB04274]|uniref:YhdH/YhfP family quinone oxidoreductase n=1 Tax=Mucilaginibacter sp. PAMB04274 TaxID=3138568 RepID=UPI0031F5FB53